MIFLKNQGQKQLNSKFRLVWTFNLSISNGSREEFLRQSYFKNVFFDRVFYDTIADANF